MTFCAADYSGIILKLSMLLKIGIFEVVVVACATRPSERLRQNQVQVASPMVWGVTPACLVGASACAR